MSEKDIRSKAEIKSEIDKNKAETEQIAAETRKETAEAIKAELEAEFASLELKKRKDDIAQHGEGEKIQIGVVAQELETVCPKLVTAIPDVDSEGNDLGTTTKSVNYSV